MTHRAGMDLGSQRKRLKSLLDARTEEMPQAARQQVKEVAERLFPGTEEVPLLEPGTLLGRYRIERILGSGGQAVVYLGRHRDLDRRAAIKVPVGVASHRMIKEAKALATLEHPHILDILDIELAGAQPHLVLEYCAGGSLADRLEAEGGPLDPNEVVSIGLDVLDGLVAAHAQGVVHRDLKPENILFDGHGQVKIADFGIGRVVAEQLSLSLTSGDATGLIGTPLYLAPEQERPGQPVDGRTDLFAFGKLLYHMLTGHRPRSVKPVERVRQELDPRWSDLIFKLVETNPQDRFQRAEDTAAALEALAPRPTAPLEGPAPAPDQTPVPVGDDASWARRLGRVVAAVQHGNDGYLQPAARVVGPWLHRHRTAFGYYLGFAGLALAVLALLVSGDHRTQALLGGAFLSSFGFVFAWLSHRWEEMGWGDGGMLALRLAAPTVLGLAAVERFGPDRDGFVYAAVILFCAATVLGWFIRSVHRPLRWFRTGTVMVVGVGLAGLALVIEANVTGWDVTPWGRLVFARLDVLPLMVAVLAVLLFEVAHLLRRGHRADLGLAVAVVLAGVAVGSAAFADLQRSAQPPIEEGISLLVEELLDSDTEIRQTSDGHRVSTSKRWENVVDTLADVGDRAVPQLIEALSHEDIRVRGGAAQALGQIGWSARDAEPALRELVKTDGSWVRQRAEQALGRINR